MKDIISSKDAPIPLGAYSQAVEARGLVFCSGQIGIDPRSGKLVSEIPEEQTEQCLSNLEAVLRGAELSLESIVRTTIYLTDMDDFQSVDGVYSRRFKNRAPARVAIGVTSLPKGARVEIDAIAVRE